MKLKIIGFKQIISELCSSTLLNICFTVSTENSASNDELDFNEIVMVFFISFSQI